MSKQKLIKDIEQLLNSYDAKESTSINPALLEFMDEKTLKEIINSLLSQKETTVEDNQEWLNKFKTIE